MANTTMYILIGIVIVAILALAVALIRRGREPRNIERSAGRQILILGIVFLIPGLVNLIVDGETSAFLSLGIIFTLSGLVSVFLLKPSIFPGDSAQIRTGGLIGFLVGGAAGTAVSMFFDIPSVLAILLMASLGVLAGIVIGIIYRRSSQV